MNTLIKDIKSLQDSPVSMQVDKTLLDFKKLGIKGNKEWFSELCFCILTANSKAQTAINIQKELGFIGFSSFSQEKISSTIRSNGHRFHNNKSRFIVLARDFQNIKSILKKEKDPRDWLVKNIKGIAWKESSHFLRNVGYTNYAILDRHIINLLFDMGYLKEKPKTLNKQTYYDIEILFQKLAKQLDMSCAQLDLYMWKIKTGKILK